MGASQSTNSVSVVNKAIISVLTKNANNCSSNSVQNQQINYSGFGLFGGSSQSSNVSVKCLQNVKMDNNLSTQIAQQIQQQAAAQGIALLPNYNGSTNIGNLSNYISTKLTDKVIQDCASSVLQNQQNNVGGVQIGLYNSQNVNAVTSCLQKTLNKNKISQGIVQNVNQVATTKTSNPLNFLGNLFKGMALEIFAVIFLIIIVAYILMGGFSKKENNPVRSYPRYSPSLETSRYNPPVYNRPRSSTIYSPIPSSTGFIGPVTENVSEFGQTETSNPEQVETLNPEQTETLNPEQVETSNQPIPQIVTEEQIQKPTTEEQI